MADITITIPEAFEETIYNAIAARHNYNAATDGTKANFLRTVLIRLLKDEVRGYQVTVATAAAAETASTIVDGINIRSR